MKKQIIYTIIIFAVVCAVLILSITFFSIKGSLFETNISQEVFKKNLVPRDITEELTEIKNFISKAEMPDEAEIAKKIKEAVKRAINAWDECQELVNSKKLKYEYNKNEMFMTSYKDDVNNIRFIIVLLTEKGEISQCTKRISYPEGDGNKIKSYYTLFFNEDFNMKTYKDPNAYISFYPSGLVGGVSYDMPEGKRYSISWSEDGKITRQENYDKNNKSPSTIRAEERARKIFKEMQEREQREQKYFEEYRKMMNMDDANFNIDVDHYNQWIMTKLKDPNK